MSWAGSGKYSTYASGKNCNSVSMCCCWLDIFLGQSTHDVVSADRDFYKAIKKYLLIVDNFLLQCTTVTSTQDKSKSTSSFDHFKFSYDLFHPHSLDRCLSGTKQSSLTVKCLDIGHCLRRQWENGKSQWPAINISVSAVFVFMSLLLPNSHLASYLSSSGSSFSCHCLVSISLLSHTTILW